MMTYDRFAAAVQREAARISASVHDGGRASGKLCRTTQRDQSLRARERFARSRGASTEEAQLPMYELARRTELFRGVATTQHATRRSMSRERRQNAAVLASAKRRLVEGASAQDVGGYNAESKRTRAPSPPTLPGAGPGQEVLSASLGRSARSLRAEAAREATSSRPGRGQLLHAASTSSMTILPSQPAPLSPAPRQRPMQHGPAAGRAYPGMGDFTPLSHAFRDREPDKELFSPAMCTGLSPPPRRAYLGGGAPADDGTQRVVEMEHEARAQPPAPPKGVVMASCPYSPAPDPTVPVPLRGRRFEMSVRSEDLFDPYGWSAWSIPVTREATRDFEPATAAARRREAARHAAREEVGQRISDGLARGAGAAPRYAATRQAKLARAIANARGMAVVDPSVAATKRLLDTASPALSQGQPAEGSTRASRLASDSAASGSRLPPSRPTSGWARAAGAGMTRLSRLSTPMRPGTGSFAGFFDDEAGPSEEKTSEPQAAAVTFRDKAAFLVVVDPKKVPSRLEVPRKADAVAVAMGTRPLTLSGRPAGPGVALADGSLPTSAVRTRRLADHSVDEAEAVLEMARAEQSKTARRRLRSAQALVLAATVVPHARTTHEDHRVNDGSGAAQPVWAMSSAQPVTLHDADAAIAGRGLTSRASSRNTAASSHGLAGDASLRPRPSLGRSDTHRKAVAREAGAARGPALGILPTSGEVPRRPLFSVVGADSAVHNRRVGFVPPVGRTDATRPTSLQAVPAFGVSERPFVNLTRTVSRHVRPTQHLARVARHADAEVVASSLRRPAGGKEMFVAGPTMRRVAGIRRSAANAKKRIAGSPSS